MRFIVFTCFLALAVSNCNAQLFKGLFKKNKEEEKTIDTLQKAEGDQGITSPIHQEYIGKVVFSNQTIDLQNEDKTKFKNSFQTGELIKFRAYFKESSYNSMVEHYTNNGVYRDSAFALGNGGFRPRIYLRYYLNDEFITERYYGGEFNFMNNPPTSFISERGFEFLCQYTTYRGTLYDTEFAHEEIEDFTKLLTKMKPGQNKVRLDVFSTNNSIVEEKRKQNNALHEVILASGEFDFDYNPNKDISENEAVCIPKNKLTSETQQDLVKAWLKDHSIQYQQLALTKYYNSSNSDGKYQRIHVVYGSKKDGCKMTFIVLERQYNYVTGKYSNELQSVQHEESDIPCACLK